MAQYRKKPIVIEAEQWYPGKQVEGVIHPIEGSEIPGVKVIGKLSGELNDFGYIHTLEGGHFVSPGDWIITGVKSEKYPCKPDIFEATYEAVVA